MYYECIVILFLIQNIELNRQHKEFQVLIDEVDVMKHRWEQMDKLESNMNMCKIRLEEMEDLRNQVRSLDEDNSRYSNKITMLEEEVRITDTLRSKEGSYKKQIKKLHEQSANDEIKIKKLECELKVSDDACRVLRNEKLDSERLQNGHNSQLIQMQVQAENERVNIFNTVKDKLEKLCKLCFKCFLY